jgi:gliding motility-associated-like protein
VKKIYLTILFFLNVGVLHATHQRAAEITYRHVAGTERTYAFTLITFTYSLSQADRPSLAIKWRGQSGGGETDTVIRSRIIDYPAEQTRENHYFFNITFPGAGTYTISMEDPNRNGGVLNMPNSLNTAIYVETTLFISPFMSPNSSPMLLNKPVDIGCLDIPFMHNPGAFDPDGDSLSYRLINCRALDGLDIPGYHLPRASNFIEINPVTGDLIWDSPTMEGEYNLAILVEEFRAGVRIGSVTRDMQVNIQRCDNRPPELVVPEKICVFVGDTLRVPVLATDPDTADILTLSATGGIFLLNQNKAEFLDSNRVGKSPLHDTLIWIPRHADVQRNLHSVYFRVRDNGRPNLNTLKTLFIQVVGKAPQWDSIVPTFESISLHWTPIMDENIFGYRIFRAQERSGTTQDSCDFGFNDKVYRLLDTIKDRRISTYIDTDVDQNLQYCYRIVTLYRNGMEGQMSEEICMTQLSKTPILEQVSVVETNENFGKIQLTWRKPLDFDIVSSGANFRYVIHRSNNTEFQDIATITNIHDTTYLDEQLGLNTQNFPHTYKIELIQCWELPCESIGFSSEATSIFANATGRNKRVNVQWQVSQPWKTEGFTIYRKKDSELNFDSIGFTNQNYFTDTDVINDSSYTYKIKAFGRHYHERINDYTLINWSQETRATPQIDTPCIQILIVEPNCKPLESRLEWWSEEDCYDDDLIYHIFYSSSKNGTFREIDSVRSDFFIHQNIFAGCHYIKAINVKNLYSISDTICISSQQYYQECMDYRLPNVFTPNGDGINDMFKALPNVYSGVFTIKIFNRWGNIVFESNDPDFEWDGNNQNTGQPCSDGVYFYVAELFLPLGERLEKQTRRGHVTLLR